MTRSRHHTAWAGALAVAAELSRREYDVAITLGNTPALDLICSSPTGKPFTVQVKSLSASNWVLIPKHQLEQVPRTDLFFVVVLVPMHEGRAFEFHVLTHAEVCAHYSKQRGVKKNGLPYKPGYEGLSWGDVRQHYGCWGKLPK